MLKRLGKNIYNAHFICPDSLQEAHDTAQRKLQA
ncbi:PcfJ domain-containing protein [Porphyromonas gingivalis]|nr:hypothetical protein [Porphyromonas gingivalis]WIM92362.1 hypothetical protein QP877_04995 [Porphyromonas gingivalis]